MSDKVVVLKSTRRTDRERSGPLMAAMDACNAHFGPGTVVSARASLEERRSRSKTFERRTPRYTTPLDERPVVGSA